MNTLHYIFSIWLAVFIAGLLMLLEGANWPASYIAVLASSLGMYWTRPNA